MDVSLHQIRYHRVAWGLVVLDEFLHFLDIRIFYAEFELVLLTIDSLLEEVAIVIQTIHNTVLDFDWIKDLVDGFEYSRVAIWKHVFDVIVRRVD